VSGESKLVLSLDTVRPEVSAAAEGPARRVECGASKLVLSLHAVRPEVSAAAEGPARRAECGASKLVLSLHAIRPEVSAAAEGPARRPLSMVSPSWFSACTPYALKLDADTRRTNSIVSMTLSPRSCHTVNPTTRFMAIIQVNLR